jgi:hypothetical protein
VTTVTDAELVETGVVCLGAETDLAGRRVDGLLLLLDDAGLTVRGPTPGALRFVPWQSVGALAFEQPAVLADGRPAVTVVVATRGCELRFRVACSDLPPPRARALAAGLVALAERSQASAHRAASVPGSRWSEDPAVTAPIPICPAAGAPPAAVAPSSATAAPRTGEAAASGPGVVHLPVAPADRRVVVGRRQRHRRRLRSGRVLVAVLAVFATVGVGVLAVGTRASTATKPVPPAAGAADPRRPHAPATASNDGDRAQLPGPTAATAASAA